MLRNCPDEEFVVEALGILGNLTIPDLNFKQLLMDFEVLSYIKNKVQPGRTRTRTTSTKNRNSNDNNVNSVDRNDLKMMKNFMDNNVIITATNIYFIS